MAFILFSLTSIMWGIVGVAMAVVPQVWTRFIRQVLGDDWKRFWFTQGMLFLGLVLVVGTAEFQGFWIWVTCGMVIVGKACVLLGAGRDFRTRLLGLLDRWPMWAYRCGGVAMVILAVCLATDVILNS